MAEREKYKLRIISSLKPGINDPEGNTIKQALIQMGFDVSDVRVGRFIDGQINGSPVKLVEAVKNPKGPDMPHLGSRILHNYESKIIPE